MTVFLRSELGVFRGEVAAVLGCVRNREPADDLVSFTLFELMNIVCGGILKSVGMVVCFCCVSTVVGRAAFWVGARLAQVCDTTETSTEEDTCGLKGLKEFATDSPGALVSWERAELMVDIGEKLRG